ncbi:MAG: 30S ribosomal protein S18 [Candidatus Obscuribacterales bacterium]|jgi:small subunit ribosomal protein S18|nr:30S ribosomal protein S18 [Candidatus Obscuribacterales bacterium]
MPRRESYGATRQKSCKLCQDKIFEIDYKDTMRLRKFLSENGKILGRRITGNCSEHQKQITLAVKRSREICLIANGYE